MSTSSLPGPHHPPRRRALAVLGGLAALVLASPKVHAQGTVPAKPSGSASPPEATAAATAAEDYTVVAGDSCLSIANRVLGSAGALDALHRLNLQLGPTPHKLVAGQKLKVPRRTPVDADANLTAARGDVAVRKPATSAWDAAHRGMDLFRAWRVGARAASSAEVTFRDQTRLHLRENTIVIIYGPAAPRQPATALRAEIEGGSLVARLAAATGTSTGTEILTPSALTTVSRSDVLFSVDRLGTSLVANHAGEPAEVRAVTRRQPRGAAVRVTSGMGSRVEAGKLPEPPRPLPARPTFSQPILIVSTFAAAAPVKVSWPAVPGAIQYRAVVLDAQGTEQNVVIIPPGETSFELADVPPGQVRVALSAIDSAGFEGAPSELEVRVVAVAMSSPGDAAPAAAPAGVGSAAPAASLAAARKKVAVGARLLGPPGMTCTLRPVDSAAGPAESVARRPGAYHAECGETGTAGAAQAAAELDVVPVTAAVVGTAAVARDQATTLTIAITSEGALGSTIEARASAGLTIAAQRWDGKTLQVELRGGASSAATETLRIVAGDVELSTLALAVPAPAPLAPRAPRWALELGGIAGLVLPPAGSRLGAPQAERDRLASGPLLGALLALRQRQRPWLAGRLGLGAASLSQLGSSSNATLLLSAAEVALRPAALGSVEVWTFAGVGAARLASAPGSTRPQTAGTADAGASVVVRNAGLAFELAAVWSLLRPGDDRELWPSVRLGISSMIDR